MLDENSARLRMSKNAFLIRSKDDYPIVYTPLKGCVHSISITEAKILAGSIECPNLLSQLSSSRIGDLKNGGVLEDDVSENTVNSGILERCYNDDIDMHPTALTIFVTNKCNLKCEYCYASAGDHEPKDIPIEVAEKAIDVIVENANISKTEGIQISFHGGGEPFTRMRLIETISTYARRASRINDLELSLTAGTNGILNENKRNWIKDNLSHVTLSFDGPEDVQNSQRSMRGSGNSYLHVLETIEDFERSGFSYSLRATITNRNILRLRDLIDCVSRHTTKKTIAVEPVVESGRAQSGNLSVDPKEFVALYLDAVAYAESFGIELSYSGVRLDGIRRRFCGVGGDNFFVTPDGYISSCLEVTSGSDIRAADFIFGEFRERGLVLSAEKLSRLRSRRVDNMPSCEACFAKYSCGGDCPVRAAKQSGDLFSSEGSERCIINRMILADHLQKQFVKRFHFGGCDGEI